MSLAPKLAERFKQPDNWQTRFFHNEDTEHRLYFGWSAPQNPKGVVILLQGLQEFTEKYYETARFYLSNGYAVVLFDWQYQGRSNRLQSNPHKRHSDGFDSDVDDLKRLIEEEIKQLFADLPLHMLSHSTGGNIGLRYLLQYPQDFKTASFSAPLMGIYSLSKIPDALILPLIKALNIFPAAYVPGGKNWRESERKSDGTDKFSSDPARDAITNAWYKFDPSLQGGAPTMKWLLSAYESMRFLKDPQTLSQIKTPCFFCIAEKDIIVCSDTSNKTAQSMPNIKVLELKNAKHEILMETDDIRDEFLNKSLELMNA